MRSWPAPRTSPASSPPGRATCRPAGRRSGARSPGATTPSPGPAESIAPRLAGAEQRSLLGQLEREHDNIRAVLDLAAAAGDGHTAIRLAFAMWRFWQKRGHLHQARRRLEAYAAAPWSRDDPVLRARLMEALGGVLWWQADIAAMALAARGGG